MSPPETSTLQQRTWNRCAACADIRTRMFRSFSGDLLLRSAPCQLRRTACGINLRKILGFPPSATYTRTCTPFDFERDGHRLINCLSSIWGGICYGFDGQAAGVNGSNANAIEDCYCNGGASHHSTPLQQLQPKWAHSTVNSIFRMASVADSMLKFQDPTRIDGKACTAPPSWNSWMALCGLSPPALSLKGLATIEVLGGGTTLNQPNHYTNFVFS